MDWLCNIFGYLLNYIYTFVNNYGLALIIFSLITKIIMMPLSIKQHKTLKKSGKIQKELREIQDKYSNDQERLAQETMSLYKRENMSPFSGCLSSILQIVLLLAMFFLVRDPLTYMLKVPQEKIAEYEKMINTKSAYSEIEVIKAAKTNENIDIDLNMDFLGIDLSNVLISDFNNWTAYIIPILYVGSSILSIKLNSITTEGKKEKKKKKDKDNEEEENPMEQMNKNMQLMMPIMSVMIAIAVPLGLALYWLTNNILMIVEKLVLNKVYKDKEEAK